MEGSRGQPLRLRTIGDQRLRPGRDAMLEHMRIREERLKLALPEQMNIFPLTFRIPADRVALAQPALHHLWHKLVEWQLIVQLDRKPFPWRCDEVGSAH